MLRGLVRGMIDQRPGNEAEGRGEMWDLEDEEREWISRMVDRHRELSLSLIKLSSRSYRMQSDRPWPVTLTLS